MLGIDDARTSRTDDLTRPARRKLVARRHRHDTHPARVARRRATLTVSYYATDPSFSADTDTPRMPARYHRIWIDLAVIQAYHDSDNFPGAQALRAQVAADLQSMISRYETRNRRTPVHPPPRRVEDE